MIAPSTKPKPCCLPRWRAALYDEICGLGAQAFMTGTGVELFAELDGRAQGFEVREAAGGSEIREAVLR
jgi:DNA replication and repair protein RecF